MRNLFFALVFMLVGSFAFGSTRFCDEVVEVSEYVDFFGNQVTVEVVLTTNEGQLDDVAPGQPIYECTVTVSSGHFFSQTSTGFGPTLLSACNNAYEAIWDL